MKNEREERTRGMDHMSSPRPHVPGYAAESAYRSLASPQSPQVHWMTPAAWFGAAVIQQSRAL